MALSPATSTAASLVQPVANPGTDPDFPASAYPWVGTVTAVALAPAGSLSLQLLSDGTVNQTIPLVINPPAQTVFVTQADIVVTAAT